jgi:hypothetical protein
MGAHDEQGYEVADGAASLLDDLVLVRSVGRHDERGGLNGELAGRVVEVGVAADEDFLHRVSLEEALQPPAARGARDLGLGLAEIDQAFTGDLFERPGVATRLDPAAQDVLEDDGGPLAAAQAQNSFPVPGLGIELQDGQPDIVSPAESGQLVSPAVDNELVRILLIVDLTQNGGGFSLMAEILTPSFKSGAGA